MSLREWIARIRFFFFPATAAELNEELQFHLEQSVDANLALGMDPAEARRRALVEFGCMEKNRDEAYRQRPGWFFETLGQDVHYALRSFRRNLSFTLTVIATLALGIGATTAVFSVVDRILFRSLPYAEDDRLVSMGLVQPLQKQEFMLGGFFYEWQAGQKPFSSMTFEGGTHDCNVTETSPAHLQCANAAQNLLPTLGIAPVLGRNFLPAEDLPHGPKVALITDGLWLSRYNRNPRVLDKNISLDGRSVRIVGVLPRSFEMPRLQPADIILPAQMDVAAQHSLNSGIGLPMWAFARLKPGVSLTEAQAQMQPFFLHTREWIPPQIREGFRLQIRPVRALQMQDATHAAWLLLATVFAVLLIACANVASLFSAREVARQRELAVRSALGASRRRLLRQTLTEALLLAFVGALLGCGLAEALLRVFVRIAPTGIPFLSDAHLDLRIVAFSVLLSLFCAVLFGITGAMDRPRPSALVSRASPSRAQARLRRAMVAAQMAFSVVLLSGAGLLLKSFAHLEAQQLGMTADDVITVRVPLNQERYPHGYMDFDLRAEAAMQALPGVSGVGMSDSLPPDGWHNGMGYAQMFVVGRAQSEPRVGDSVVSRSVTPEYFRALRIPIVRGPGFREEDRTGSSDLLVLSRTLAARLFPQQDPIGRHIRFGRFTPFFVADPTAFTVVGVAEDVKNGGLASVDEPEFYTLKRTRDPESFGPHHFFLLRSSLPASALAGTIRTEMARLDPLAPVEIRPLAQQVSELADRPRFETALLGFFALCGTVMAVIGLYGVIAYAASQRTQEIGVRMALGATRADILRLIASEGMWIASTGVLIGLGVALPMARLVRSLLFKVSPHDPLVYGAVGALLALVALCATLLPATAAMRIDPMQALRRE